MRLLEDALGERESEVQIKEWDGSTGNLSLYLRRIASGVIMSGWFCPLSRSRIGSVPVTATFSKNCLVFITHYNSREHRYLDA